MSPRRNKLSPKSRTVFECQISSHEKSKPQTSAFLPKNLIKLLNQEIYALFYAF